MRERECEKEKKSERANEVEKAEKDAGGSRDFFFLACFFFSERRCTFFSSPSSTFARC